MLQRYIHALADSFVNVKKYQQVFLAPLSGTNNHGDDAKKHQQWHGVKEFTRYIFKIIRLSYRLHFMQG
jgi:hypothetical protein